MGRVTTPRDGPLGERALPYEKAPQPALPTDGILECDVRTLASIVAAIVAVETPVHEDDVVARVSGFWEQRSGARIRAHISTACDVAAREKTIERRGEFLWHPAGKVRVRDRSDSGIGADRIAPEEYDAAIRLVLAVGQAVRHETLLTEARSLLGFERTGSTLSAALDAALGRLLATGEIGEGSAGYKLLNPPPDL